ncbi:MAG: DUF1398 family protein [Acidobacteriota bacterium]
MNIAALHHTTSRSLAGTMTFPQVVGLLLGEGVESYQADLVTREKTFHMPNGETHRETLDIQPLAIAADFSGPEVVSAIRDIQQQKINYRQFLDRIAAAGTTTYTVYLQGKRAIYFGRNGDFHIEEFPKAN